MKSLSGLLLLSVLSCGKIEVPESKSAIGETFALSTSAPFSAEERVRLTSVCQALAKKTSILNAQLPQRLYTFDVRRTGCDGEVTTSDRVNVSIQKENSNFIFSGIGFPIPNVETTQTGVLAEVCKNVASITQMPIQKSSNEAIFVSTLRSADCSPGVNEICVQIKTAFKNETNYQVHTSEWLRIYTNISDTNAHLHGFYTDRSIVTTGFCSENKSVSTRLTLIP